MSYDRHLQELALPFPPKYIHDDGRGNAYVPHHIVTQRLIQIFGKPPKIEILRETYDGDKLTGVFMRLTVPGFEPIEEAGEADNPQSKTNGARAKDACSDAIKRCAMRLGLGLHLWAQNDYFLHKVLTRDSQPQDVTEPKERAGVSSLEVPSETPEEVAGDGGEVTAEASSGVNIYEVISNAMADKELSKKILPAANRAALKKRAIPKDGISRQNVLELPEEVLEIVADELNLRQEALV